MTPADLLRDTYALMRMHACEDVRKHAHVPPLLAGIVTSPYNPPELHVYALLDARLAPTQMRSLAQSDEAIYGFVFLTLGTTLHERDDDPEPEVRGALLCLWCTRHAAGGDSYRIRPGNLLDSPQPLPDALVSLYTSIFDPTATLPTAFAPTPH